MRKISLGILFLVAFFILLASFAVAEICSTGEVCSCGDQIVGNVTLDRDIYCRNSDPALSFSFNDSSLDCNGHSIIGDGDGTGILISLDSNITVRNCNVFNFKSGLQSFESNNVVIEDSIFYGAHRVLSFFSEDKNRQAKITNTKACGNFMKMNILLGFDLFCFGTEITGQGNQFDRTSDNCGGDWPVLDVDYSVCDAEEMGDNDGDRIPNVIDNCLEVVNENQVDDDNNGIGDACEDSGEDVIRCGDTINEDTVLGHNLLNCQEFGLMIGQNGVTLDCDYNTISGTGDETGIQIPSKNNVTIKNCMLRDFRDGIDFWGDNNVIENNIILNTTDKAIYLVFGGEGNRIISNIAYGYGNSKLDLSQDSGTFIQDNFFCTINDRQSFFCGDGNFGIYGNGNYFTQNPTVCDGWPVLDEHYSICTADDTVDSDDDLIPDIIDNCPDVANVRQGGDCGEAVIEEAVAETGGECGELGVRQRINNAWHVCEDISDSNEWRILLLQPCQRDNECVSNSFCEEGECVGQEGTLCGNNNAICANGLFCNVETELCAEPVEEEIIYSRGDQCEQDDGSDGVYLWSYILSGEQDIFNQQIEPERQACCSQGQCADQRGLCRTQGLWWEQGAIVAEENINRYICENSNWYDCKDDQSHDLHVINGQEYICLNNQWESCANNRKTCAGKEVQEPVEEPEAEVEPVRECNVEDCAKSLICNFQGRCELEPLCHDTDPDNNLYLRGTVSNIKEIIEGPLMDIEPQQDYCQGNQVREIYCGEYGTSGASLHDCPGEEICQEGVCAEPVVEPEEELLVALLGDIDGNGQVEEADARLVFDHVIDIEELNPERRRFADVNHCKVGRVGITNIDGILIQRFAQGIINGFPCELPDEEVVEGPAIK